MVLPLKKSIIYGPVNSRRLGKSLGINLLPAGSKYCSFDCLYCHYGRTRILSSEVADRALVPDIHQVIREIDKALRSDIDFAYLTFSGNGEPTLHPDFPEIVRQVFPLMRKMRPRVKLALLSNATTIHCSEIREAVETLDLPIMKLDCGTDLLTRRINRPASGFDFNSMVKNLAGLGKITIQSVFLTDAVDNSDNDSVRKWIDTIGLIRPRAVQIYSLDRPTAYSALKSVMPERLLEIADDCRKATRVPVEVY